MQNWINGLKPMLSLCRNRSIALLWKSLVWAGNTGFKSTSKAIKDFVKSSETLQKSEKLINILHWPNFSDTWIAKMNETLNPWNLCIIFKRWLTTWFTKHKSLPENIYLFKVNDRNNPKRYETCLKLTIKAHNFVVNDVVHGAFIANFEHISSFHCYFEQVNAC